MSRSVLESWARLVESGPDEIALITPGGLGVTRSELDERSDQIRDQWATEGLRAHRIVMLNLPNGIDWMEAYLACLKLGAVVISLDPGIGETETRAISKEVRAQAFRSGEGLQTGIVEKPYQFRREDISVGKLTSGSTGRAKRLFFTESEIVADARMLIACMAIRPTDVNLGIIPWGHSYGLGNIVYPLLINGTRIAWTDTTFPSEIGTVCRKAKCTLFPSVPTVIRALSLSDCQKTDFKTLRLTISAGARLDQSNAQAFLARFGKRVHNFYGSTETGGICFDDTGDAALSGRSVGKPIKGVSIYKGQGKRFYVASPAVYSFGNRKVSPSGLSMALMADYGELDERGELVLEGRAKNLLKIGARRINPLELERKLRLIDGVSDAAVFSIDRKGEAIIASAIESSLPRRELIPEIKESIAARYQPKKWIVYDRFPVTARGKVDIRAIKQDFL